MSTRVLQSIVLSAIVVSSAVAIVLLRQESATDFMVINDVMSKDSAPSIQVDSGRSEQNDMPDNEDLVPPQSDSLIFGTVRNREKALVSGALVEIRWDTGYNMPENLKEFVLPELASAQTDDSGYYEVESRWTLPFEIVAYKPSVAVGKARGSTPGKYDIILDGDWTLHVKTLDLDGAPIQYSIVKVHCQESGIVQRAISNLQGDCVVSALSPGAWAVSADHDEHCNVTLLTQSDEWVKRTLEITLIKGGIVEGRVIDARNGAGVPARVQLHYKEQHSTIASNEGYFRLAGVSLEDTWDIRVHAEGFGASTFFVKLMAEEPTAYITIALEPSRTISGIVFGPEGPVHGARVLALGYYGDGDRGAADVDFSTAMSTENGAFNVSGLRKDVWHTVLIQYSGLSRVSVSVPPSPQEAVNVGSVDLSTPCEIRVVIQDEIGAPVTDARIGVEFPEPRRSRVMHVPGFGWNIGWLLKPELQNSILRTKLDGSCAILDARLGDILKLHFKHPKYQPFMHEIAVSNYQMSLSLLATRGCIIQGLVVEHESGSPLHDAIVRLDYGTIQTAANQGSRSFETRTSKSGDFSFVNASPGLVAVCVSKSGWHEGVTEAFASSNSTGESIEVRLSSKRVALVKRYTEAIRAVDSGIDAESIERAVSQVGSQKEIPQSIQSSLPDLDMEAVRRLVLLADLSDSKQQAERRIENLVDALAQGSESMNTEHQEGLRAILTQSALELVDVYYEVLAERVQQSPLLDSFHQRQATLTGEVGDEIAKYIEASGNSSESDIVLNRWMEILRKSLEILLE